MLVLGLFYACPGLVLSLFPVKGELKKEEEQGDQWRRETWPHPFGQVFLLKTILSLFSFQSLQSVAHPRRRRRGHSSCRIWHDFCHRGFKETLKETNSNLANSRLSIAKIGAEPRSSVIACYLSIS